MINMKSKEINAEETKENEKRNKKSSSRLWVEVVLVVCSVLVGIVIGRNTSSQPPQPWEGRETNSSETVNRKSDHGGLQRKECSCELGEEGNVTQAEEHDVDDDIEEEWENFTAWQLYDYLKCSSFAEFRWKPPIRSQETYTLMRETYFNVVGPENSTIGPPSDGSNGFHFPYAVKKSYDKGRGIYATEDIPKGELVWSNDRAAIFPNSWYYRKFLVALPPDVACDCMQWTYIYDLNGEGKDKKMIMIDLDEGALCNDGEADEEEEEGESNLGWDKELAEKVPVVGNGMHFFALRDIKAGEEFLCNYTEFSAPEGEWDWARHGLDWVIRDGREENPYEFSIE